MKKVINCYKEFNPVIQRKLKEVTVEEGLEIATELFNILNERKDGIGLAANQVGINASVAVLNVREPIILINPVVTEQWDEIDYYEGCLSYPNKGIRTKRYKNIIIQTAQEESGWYFSGVETGKDDEGERLLEAVCVQHEIDHLNGMTIHDRKIDTTIRAEKKIGRNQKVLIACGTDSRVVKYKKAIPLLENGWTLVES
jgi:peptide deformylase|tara:strand:- start:161 stop:757 length:597 start_codon:yes stop_codon:yes gene_type:complete